MQLPLVSIVTPSYNQVAYLEDAIRSVMAQDYEAIEYIIVDGASSDGSQEIIHKYASRLAWWVSEPDEGQAVAINKGLTQAKGKILAWLNSDDLYLPGAVRQAVAALQAFPDTGLVYGNAITIDARGCPINELAFPDWGLRDLIAFRIICQPAVFMRRELYDAAGGLDASYKFMLDHHLWIRLASQAPVRHIQARWAAARYHEAAKNVVRAAEFGGEVFRILEWMQTQPDLAPSVKENWRKVLAGAHRLNARYLLEGGLPGAALKAYWQAFRFDPSYTLRHWHRILFAVISVLGGKGYAGWYHRLQNKTHPPIDLGSGLESWPGLLLEERRTQL